MVWEADFATIAELRYMNQDAGVWSFATRPQHLVQLPTDEWAAALTAMRNYVTRASDARIVLGGQTAGYLGRMPASRRGVRFRGGGTAIVCHRRIRPEPLRR